MSSIVTEKHFLPTFTSIPLVVSVIDMSSTLYGNLKKYSPYVDQTLSTTEQLVIYIVNQPSVQSVALKLEKPLALVDSYAFDGLHMLEQKYPSIRMAPEEMKEEAYNQMIILKGITAKKLDQLLSPICRQRRHGMYKAMLLLETILSPKVEVYVDSIEKSVDQYLPPLEDRDDEPDYVNEEARRMFARLWSIPFTVKDRLTQRYNQLVFNNSLKYEN